MNVKFFGKLDGWMVGVGASNPNQSARRRAKYKSQLQMSTGHAVGLGNERLGAR